MKLSILIPVYNEEKSVGEILTKVDNLKFSNIQKEIIIVDDGSQDNSLREIERFLKKAGGNSHLYKHSVNQGKANAIKTGILHATGDYIIIQDSDTEYNPRDILQLVRGIKGGRSVIYGTRLNRLPHLKDEERKKLFILHYVGNRLLSLVTSVLYGQWITDMETCYKLFPLQAVKNMTLHARGFAFEPEITAKLLKAGYKIEEYPITTKPRDYSEGKKLQAWKDGPIALWTLIKYRFTD